MIRSIRFPKKESADFRYTLNKAGDDFQIFIIPESTKEGDGVKYSLAVRSFDGRSLKTVNGVECNEDPTNSSHVCPHPVLCP